MAVGAVLGGLAVYLYDPVSGENRRARLASIWRENRNGALQAGRTASETIDSARPLARRLTKAIGRRRATSLPALLGAAAVGGTAVYFMDPVKGSARRLQAFGIGRDVVRQIGNVAKPLPGQVGDQFTNAVGRIRAAV
jgi:hypothetical protein